LSLPTVDFFGFADQDFTDDRWVKSTLVPDVERRGGVLELRLTLPEKLMLNRVAKPSGTMLIDWRNEIERWIERKLNSLDRLGKVVGIRPSKDSVYIQNLQGFWEIVEDAAEKAQALSDFNAFVISRVVNGAWGYDTLFCRFSECQRIFEQEFSALLSRFEEYSRYVREATLHSPEPDKGVYEQENVTLPFWLHCDCGSKVRLVSKSEGGMLKGSGKCLRCQKEHHLDSSALERHGIEEIVDRISARSIVMPLIFFDGLKVCCYIGGLAGKTYLDQARYVAENMRLAYPPVVIWRPKDLYFGLGQLEALLEFRRLSGSFDLSQYSALKDSLAKEISSVRRQIEELESRKERLSDNMKGDTVGRIEAIRALTGEQTEIRRRANLPVLMRNAVLLENVGSVLGLHPSIIDYIVNVGLRSVSEQWLAFLEKTEDLSSNVKLGTCFGADLQTLTHDSLLEMN
jgi:hypothetical protein